MQRALQVAVEAAVALVKAVEACAKLAAGAQSRRLPVGGKAGQTFLRFLHSNKSERSASEHIKRSKFLRLAIVVRDSTYASCLTQQIVKIMWVSQMTTYLIFVYLG